MCLVHCWFPWSNWKEMSGRASGRVASILAPTAEKWFCLMCKRMLVRSQFRHPWLWGRHWGLMILWTLAHSDGQPLNTHTCRPCTKKQKQCFQDACAPSEAKKRILCLPGSGHLVLHENMLADSAVLSDLFDPSLQWRVLEPAGSHRTPPLLSGGDEGH